MNPEVKESVRKAVEKDPLSRKSSESSNSSSDYVVVGDNNKSLTSPVLAYIVSENDLEDAIASPNNMINSPSTPNVVGKSIFYDCLNDPSPLNENSSFQKSDTDDDAATYEIDQEYKNDGNFTIFSNVLYLGSANINLPKSEAEILRHINELNSNSVHVGVKVKISIPNCCDGQVVLYDEDSDTVYSSFDIQAILFYAHGKKDTSDHACFAFSWTHGDPQENAIYQCHVFRCNIPEAVQQVSSCFTKAFQRIPQSMACSLASENFTLNSITSDISGNPLSQAVYEFIVSLEVREKISKSTFSNVVREKSCFKIRQNCDKEICITVKPTQSETLPPLFIERCFGVLLSIGKIKKQADMTLLELAAPGAYIKSTPDFQIIAKWDINDKPFEILDETQKSHLVTLAIDLVIKGIQEPVRFVIETQMKIDNSESQSSRFSNSFLFQGNKRPLQKKFYIQLKESGDNNWILSSIDPSDECLEPVQSTSFNQKIKNFSKMVRSTSTVSFEYDDMSPTEEPSGSVDLDEDEPLASGTGEVSKDCSQDRLDSWAPVIQEWQSVGKRPKNLALLIRSGGIPEALRCQLWQKLAYTDNRPDLTDKYRLLITKETKCEDIILRDVNRTFPAHDFFRDDGSGQESLYKVSKAYSVYDQEVGYCQGLSFIAASLLLHMPEEEAFSVLVSIMYDYGLRELYKANFENLSLRLFQMTRMLKDQLPELYDHFTRQNLELHMFASQWFLTLFTARFPLPFVFQCIDLFLLDGIDVLFKIAFALLNACKKDLLSKDFESILKYIRVSLPKKFRTETQVSKLIRKASECKVKKLKKYEEEFMIQKEENEKFEKMLMKSQMKYNEDRKMMQAEIAQLQKRVKKFEIDEKKYENIINDYKQIIQRQEQQLENLKHSTNHDNKEVKELDNSTICSLDFATQRIRELEMDLAQSKVAQVESECQSQNLQHQLNALISKMNVVQQNTNAPNSWKTKWDNVVSNMPSMPSVAQTIPSFQSHISEIAQQLNSFDESK